MWYLFLELATLGVTIFVGYWFVVAMKLIIKSESYSIQLKKEMLKEVKSRNDSQHK